MEWLKALFSRGRLTAPPKDHAAGRVLGPAGVRRTQLGLREVDLPRGVVWLRSTGEARCFLKVTGYPAHHRSTADARAWLTGYARVLNSLPGHAVLLVRSRAGGLERYAARARAQTAALARREPGGALARLSADQLAHARRLMATGRVRKTDTYVALRSPRGDVDTLLRVAQSVRERLATAGVTAELVRDERLADALAASWSPWSTEHHYQDFEGGGDTLTLNYSPGHARVTEPRYASLPDQRARPGAPAPPRDRTAALPRHDGKALPR